MLNELLNKYPSLCCCTEEIEKALDTIISCYTNGGKLLLCGNGGSSADCEHITGELMKGFLKKRSLSDKQKECISTRSPLLDKNILESLQVGLPAISLPSLAALNTAFCNDVDPKLIFAQSLLALGNKKDVLIAISTSGNAKNVLAAATVAKGLDITVIGLTGSGGGELLKVADICIRVPETETFKIQELHMPVYHYLCAATESHFFAE